MKSQNKYRKFQLQQKILKLWKKKILVSKECIRSTKICQMNFGIWENKEGEPIPDDFINAMVMQTSYLEKKTGSYSLIKTKPKSKAELNH